MSQTIYLATGNAHKLRELQQMFAAAELPWSVEGAAMVGPPRKARGTTALRPDCDAALGACADGATPFSCLTLGASCR